MVYAMVEIIDLVVSSTLCVATQGKGGKQVGAMPAHAKNALKQQIQEVSYSTQDVLIAVLSGQHGDFLPFAVL